MNMPCVNTILLDRHLDKLDAEQRDEDFIEDYIGEHLAEKVMELAAELAEWETSAVVDAVMNDHDHVDTYFSQALHEYQRNEREAYNDALTNAYTNLGRAVFIAGRDLLRRTARDYLEPDAEKALEQAKEKARCSCRRTGRQCEC